LNAMLILPACPGPPALFVPATSAYVLLD